MRKKIECSEIRLGVKFNAPVFFDDGKNMFLAAGLEAKPYHLAALKRWNVPFLVTGGTELSASNKPVESKEPVSVTFDDGSDIDGILEELEEL